MSVFIVSCLMTVNLFFQSSSLWVSVIVSKHARSVGTFGNSLQDYFVVLDLIRLFASRNQMPFWRLFPKVTKSTVRITLFAITERTQNKGLWNKGPLFDPKFKKWQIRDFSEVPYSDQNLKKISVETGWKSKVLYSKQLNSPKNHHFWPP